MTYDTDGCGICGRPKLRLANGIKVCSARCDGPIPAMKREQERGK